MVSVSPDCRGNALPSRLRALVESVPGSEKESLKLEPTDCAIAVIPKRAINQNPITKYFLRNAKRPKAFMGSLIIGKSYAEEIARFLQWVLGYGFLGLNDGGAYLGYQLGQREYEYQTSLKMLAKHNSGNQQRRLQDSPTPVGNCLTQDSKIARIR